jgi:hypothetical protein
VNANTYENNIRTHIRTQNCGGGEIRTYSAVKHQIYSLARLSGSGAPPTWCAYQNVFLTRTLDFFRATRGTRTPDQLITNQLLYQLSYSGLFIQYSKVKIKSNNMLFIKFQALVSKASAKVIPFVIPQKYFSEKI